MPLLRVFWVLNGLWLLGCPTDLQDPNPPKESIPKPHTATQDASVSEIPDAGRPPNFPQDAGALVANADAGTKLPDAGPLTSPTDAGATLLANDSGSMAFDASAAMEDSGMPPAPKDAGTQIHTDEPDAGATTPTTSVDAGTHDAGALDAGTTPVLDCLGIENGNAVLDCNETCAGTAIIDNCNQCVGGITGLLGCEQDCNNIWGGDAYWDACGNCIGPGETACVIDNPDAGIDGGPESGNQEEDGGFEWDAGEEDANIDGGVVDAGYEQDGGDSSDAGPSNSTVLTDAGLLWPTLDGGEPFSDAGINKGVTDAGIPIIDAGSNTVDPAACLESYFHDHLAGLFRRTCSLCHTTDGIAHEQGATLVFASPYAGQESQIDALNYQTLTNFFNAGENNASLLWQKPTTALYHGGGEQIQESSEAEFAILDFISMYQGELACEMSSEAPLKVDDLVLTDHASALRSAALLLSDTLPTQEELGAITSNIDSLDPALDRIMNTTAFAERIAIIYEDALLTSTYRSKNTSQTLQKAWGQQTDSQGNTRGRFEWYLDFATFSPLHERDLHNELASLTAHGFSRSAKELVKHVVTNQADFGEILTAGYTMMNIYSAPIYERTDAFDAGYFDDDSYWAQREAGFPGLDGGPLPSPPMPTADRYDFRPVKIPDPVATAGLLSDINFLGTWPTSTVNLNRSRAREVLKTFLNTDILALVNRTPESFGNDDTNPTYNNPTCISCHHIMDPVAGTFQNWPHFQFQALYDPLHSNAQAQWAATDPETVLLPPGLSKSKLVPAHRMDDSLPWLAENLVDDPRFAAAVVRVIYKGLTGQAHMVDPQLSDEDYLEKKRVYQLQRAYFEELETAFTNSGRHLKTMMKAMMKSPLVRVAYFNHDNPFLPEHLGIHRMLTPEDLERKLLATTGRKWSKRFCNVGAPPGSMDNYTWCNDTDKPHMSLLVGFREACGTGYGCYAQWYPLLGGQNVFPSGGNPKRLSAENAVLNSVLQRMAAEISQRVVPRDFYLDNLSETGVYVDRILFPFIGSDPTSDDIKQNLVHLAQLFWGISYDTGHEEILAAYDLFENAQNDAWYIVIDYFLSDYHFLHQSVAPPEAQP